MKKKLITLLAACSMIATASVGLVQTAYADGITVRMEVSDGATDDQKILTFYYDGADSTYMLEGYLSFDNDNVTIDSSEITIAVPAGNGDKNADTTTGQLMYTTYLDDPLTSADKSFARATITVPTDVDVTASFRVEVMSDGEWNMPDPFTVTATIPKKAAAITPAAVTAVEKQESVSGTEEYKAQTADIYGVEITPNDESVTGAKVAFGEKTGTLNFGTVYSGQGTVVFAVILASESGDALPTLTADNVTTITANVE